MWKEASVSALAAMDDDRLREGMRGSAMRRTKVAGLRRNLETARQHAEKAAEGPADPA